jgi:hypothetical protein
MAYQIRTILPLLLPDEMYVSDFVVKTQGVKKCSKHYAFL